jgi:hypothetical protein
MGDDDERDDEPTRWARWPAPRPELDHEPSEPWARIDRGRHEAQDDS